MNNETQRKPDYLVLGHVSKDVLPGGGYAPGGTAVYAALTAQSLGLQAAVVTACDAADDFLLAPLYRAGVWVHAVPSPPTSFQNIYDQHGHRTQFLMQRGQTLNLADVPPAWQAAPITHLGPIAQELPPGASEWFNPRLLGLTPQGWMRSWTADGRVSQSPMPLPLALQTMPACALLVLSIEDLGYNTETYSTYVKLAHHVVVTQGGGEALVYENGKQIASVSAHKAEPLDPTGAGDVFAGALFTRYAQSTGLIEAVNFAHAAAACAIEAQGIEGVAGLADIEGRMKRKT